MKIDTTTATENKSILHSNTPDSTESSFTISEIHTQETISFFAESKQEQYTLFISAFRILWSKYHYTGEPLTCKTILTQIDPNDSGSNNKKIFESKLEFPEISAISSTCEMVFNESEKIFGNLHNIVDYCSIDECYEFNLIALNPDSGKIELECVIRINHAIFFSFKAPFDSQFSDVVPNSEHHFQKILNTIQQSPEKIMADILIHEAE